MSNQEKNRDNEVYILGTKESDRKQAPSKKLWLILGGAVIALLIIACIVLLRHKAPVYYFEPESKPAGVTHNTYNVPADTDTSGKPGVAIKGFIETTEETVNDVPLFVYTPHNAEMSLTVGMPDKADSSIVFVAQAADVRADNQDIVGDFVMAGKHLARGTAKTGFCAVIDGSITIGVGDQTPLLQKAIDTKGYFFRQYPLVKDGMMVENNPKNKAVRRALAIRNNQVIMIESNSLESFHDFAQALADMGVNDAIYLVGSIAYGWYYDQNRQRHEFGIEQDHMPQNTSYIVWRTISQRRKEIKD